MNKTTIELGKILAEMYANAPKNEKVTMIHLFGVKYAQDIKRVGIRDVLDESRLNLSYRTELNKAVNLAKYVISKPANSF